MACDRYYYRKYYYYYYYYKNDAEHIDTVSAKNNLSHGMIQLSKTIVRFHL